MKTVAEGKKKKKTSLDHSTDHPQLHNFIFIFRQQLQGTFERTREGEKKKPEGGQRERDSKERQRKKRGGEGNDRGKDSERGERQGGERTEKEEWREERCWWISPSTLSSSSATAKPPL